MPFQTFILATLLFLGVGLTSTVNAHAANERGAWTVTTGDNPGKVHISLQRHEGRKNNWMMSRTISRAMLEGLNLDVAEREAVSFTIARDAGTIYGEGIRLRDGASGIFTFTPNADYFDQLKKLGFEPKKKKKSNQWAYAIHDVSLDYASSMAALNIKDFNGDHLMGFRSVGGDAEFARALREANMMPEKASKLIAYRVHDVTPEYAATMRDMGLDPTPNQLIAMRVHDISPDYVRAMRAADLDGDVEDLIAMRIHDVTPAYARQITGLGFTPSRKDLVALRIHDVSPEFIGVLRKSYGTVKLKKAIAARIHGVSPEAIDAYRKLDLQPTLEQMIALRIHNVSPEYIRKLRAKGVTERNIDKLVALKIHGID